MSNVSLWREAIASPVGGLIVLTDDAGRVRALDYEGYEDRMVALARRYHGIEHFRPGASPRVMRALSAYFEGDFGALDDVPTETGGTDFQRQVWRALRTIPAGETRTYGQVAALIDRPRAVRAVGLANGANPVALIHPCHRVIGAGGRLTGYAGGLDRKAQLLALERG